MYNTENPVLIIGAGIGGLALAHGFKKYGIPFHVFEKDNDRDYRPQGYRVRIAGPAIDALRYLFDTETWRLFEATCAETRLGGIHVIDAITADVDESQDLRHPNSFARATVRPYTVDRQVFREVLLRGLSQTDISFGKRFERYEFTTDGATAHFSDGSWAQGTLIVGADGAYSRIRKQHIPNFQTPVRVGECIYGKTMLSPELRQSIAPAIMRRMSCIQDWKTGRSLSMVIEAITFPNWEVVEAEKIDCPPDYLYWVIATPEKFKGEEATEPIEPVNMTLEMTRDWHPCLRLILENQAQGQTSFLPLSTCFPKLSVWEPSPNVTLLGDAAHLMGPTAGAGANSALRDCHTLCQLLAERGSNRPEMIGAFERTMRDNAEDALLMSWDAGKLIFGQRDWKSYPQDP